MGERLVERLAQAIHERYLARVATDRRSAEAAAGVPWHELPDTYRESSRRQARDIANKLWAIGCRLVPMEGDHAEFSLTAGEVELLARAEHDRWSAERLDAGWTYGPLRDEERRTTPYLVPYDELTEQMRDYDREAVSEIPSLVALAGLRVVRVRG